MEEFLKELQELSEKYGIILKQPIVNEKISFFRGRFIPTSNGCSTTGNSSYFEELWVETTKELSVRFVKKTRTRARTNLLPRR